MRFVFVNSFLGECYELGLEIIRLDGIKEGMMMNIEMISILIYKVVLYFEFFEFLRYRLFKYSVKND